MVRVTLFSSVIDTGAVSFAGDFSVSLTCDVTSHIFTFPIAQTTSDGIAHALNSYHNTTDFVVTSPLYVPPSASVNRITYLFEVSFPLSYPRSCDLLLGTGSLTGSGLYTHLYTVSNGTTPISGNYTVTVMGTSVSLVVNRSLDVVRTSLQSSLSPLLGTQFITLSKVPNVNGLGYLYSFLSLLVTWCHLLSTRGIF